jgi:Asp-tRNA(Asn)/Glu-tRNA(Gln) amidotransferase A subunit family amidase
MAQHQLDALVFPHMSRELPPLKSTGTIYETTVCEINIAGLPVLAVPAGAYASGSPFGLVFVGPMWSEAELIGLGHAYETATSHRKPPKL